jgi:choline dehydrogenase-like flavoprotein
MAICDLAEVEDKTETQADVCIIGAGFAGLLAARGLARRGYRVAVIESGARRSNPESDILKDIDHDGRFSRALDGRARAFGGTSSLWSGRILPLDQDDFAPRPSLGLEGWPIGQRDLAPYLPEIEGAFGLDRQPYDEQANALLQVDALSGEHGFECRWPKWPTFQRRNLETRFWPEMRASKNVTVWLNATVCSHELDPLIGRIAAVRATNAQHRNLRVTAKHFIYAAGTIETTRLLLLLDRESGDRAFASCDALGAWFQDHLDAEVGKILPLDVAATHRWFTYHYIGRSRRSLHLRLNRGAREADRVNAAYASVLIDFEATHSWQALKACTRSLQSRRMDDGLVTALASVSPALIWRLFATRLIRGRLHLPREIALKLHVCVEQMPHRSNRITLSDQRDSLGVPKARLVWSPTDADERTFAATIRRLSAFWRESGFARFSEIAWAADHRPGPTIASASDFAHPSGSTRMGRDRRTSVVDGDLRCWHVKNATVISASVFPTAGASNPTCTVMQLALRAAETLKA